MDDARGCRREKEDYRVLRTFVVDATSTVNSDMSNYSRSAMHSFALHKEDV